LALLCGGDVPVYGPNEVVEAIAGFASHLDCPNESGNDQGHPIGGPIAITVYSDIIVEPGNVKHPQITLGGLSLGSILGITKPTGTLGPGTYSVIFDECQDGAYDPAYDARFSPAFRVEIPVNVPPMDASLLALKGAARANEEAAKKAQEELQGLSDLSCILRGNQECMARLAIAKGRQLPLPGSTQAAAGAISATASTAEYGALLSVFGQISGQAAGQAGRMRSYFQAIANDPPDPNFAQPTPLAPVSAISTDERGDLAPAVASVADARGTAAALAQALLHSIERYQGADQSGDGTWALVHARASKSYGIALGDQLGRLNAALTDLDSVLASGGAQEVDRAADLLRRLSAAVATSGGFTQEERRGNHSGLLTTSSRGARDYPPPSARGGVDPGPDGSGTRQGLHRRGARSPAPRRARCACGVAGVDDRDAHGTGGASGV
jgi:hypothetical protein